MHEASVFVLVLLGSLLIVTLLHERRRQQRAEIEVNQRISELAHINRRATMGELSASLAHELAQPLSAIQGACCTS
jgi:C4-dicarboxylate-specific signal transduction histidine kinase